MASTLPAVIVAAFAAVLLGCGKDPETAPAAPAFASAFEAPPSSAGAELCSDCHEAIVESYAHSAMARALGPVTTEELAPLAALAPVASPAGFHYGIFPTPDGQSFVLGETRPDTPSYAMGAELIFGIGAGVRDRSLAIAHGSSMFFAPLEVLSLPDGRSTALAPGEMIAPGSRFSFPISPECLGCHTDAPPPLTYPLNLLPPDFSPRGISCAGCHGQAEALLAHVQFQEADLAGEAPTGADPLPRLAELERPERLSVCAACHLQGDARIELANQTLGHFEVGTNITDARAIFVGANPTDEVGFVSQIERLALSACFKASELDCTTCHNPHQALAGSAAETQRVRASCIECHTGRTETPPDCARSPSPDDGDCASCHMPSTGVFDVAGITIHDHFIRKRPQVKPASQLSELRFPEAPGGDWRRFTWPGEEPPATLDDMGLWMMAFAGGGHLERARELIDTPPGATAGALAMYHHLRGSLLEGLDRLEDAAAAYETALQIDPALGASATNLGLVWMQLGRGAEAMATLDAVIERFPRAAGALRNRALVRRELGDLIGFRRDLETAFQLAPAAPVARILADSYATDQPQPNATKAQRYRALAHELDPR